MSIVRTNDAANANTNRTVRFLVEAETDKAVGLFQALKGPQDLYPFYGQNTAPTLADELAQLRLSLITRALTQWAILVGVQVADDSVGTGAGSGIVLTYETNESGVFYNNAWGTSPGAVDKHQVTDIVDTVGVGGLVGGPKTKNGLQNLANELATVSYDGGTTGPFGALSTGGTVVLPDGRTVAGALPLSVTAEASGLLVTYLAQ